MMTDILVVMFSVKKTHEGEMFSMPSNYYLGTTPLNQALIAFEKMIPIFKNKNKIEKMSLITLTDGGANFTFGNTMGDEGVEVPTDHGKPVIKVGKKQYTVATEDKYYYSSDIHTGLLFRYYKTKTRYIYYWFLCD
jgi:hypothetical protein